MQKLPFVERLIVYTDNHLRINSIKNVLIYRELLDGNTISNEFICEPQNMKEHVALIMCSSGTTGLPKGVQLTQFNLLLGRVQNQ